MNYAFPVGNAYKNMELHMFFCGSVSKQEQPWKLQRKGGQGQLFCPSVGDLERTGCTG